MYEYEVPMAEYLTYLSGLSNIHNTDTWETRCRVFYMREISELANMHAGDISVEFSICAKYLSLLICMPEIAHAFRASSSNDTTFPRMSNTIAKHHQ